MTEKMWNGTLRGVMALERKTHLDDAPAQQNEAHSADQAKNEVREVVDYRDGIAGNVGRNSHAQHKGHGQDGHCVETEAPLDFALQLGVVIDRLLGFVKQVFHGFVPPLE